MNAIDKFKKYAAETLAERMNVQGITKYRICKNLGKTQNNSTIDNILKGTGRGFNMTSLIAVCEQLDLEVIIRPKNNHESED